MSVTHTMIKAAQEAIKHRIEALEHTPALEALTPEGAEAVALALQEALAETGQAMYRAYLLAFETAAPSVQAEGEVYRFKAVRDKTFLTPFGELRLPRRCYQNADDTRSRVPLDEAWGVEGHTLSPAVREAVVYAAAHLTYEEAAGLLAKCALFRPHASTIKHEVERTGARLEAHHARVDAAVQAQERLPEQTRVWAVSLDAVRVPMAQEGVALGRRPEGQDKPVKRATAFREACVASFTYYGAVPEGEPTPARLHTHYQARMPEQKMPTLRARVEAELDAAHARLSPSAVKVVLLDGAPALWHYVHHEPRFEGYETLVDYWHAVEHLCAAAEALFGQAAKAGQLWRARWRRKLKDEDGAVKGLLRSMAAHARRARLPAARRKALADERRYFTRNGARMAYAAFRRRGLPIGSGPVEAACKSVVKTRLCRSGMRWTHEGGQHILSLRAYAKSDRWDTAWLHIKNLKNAA